MNRIQWLDIAKGIAIILMVLGHTSIPKIASDFIYAFHMPLFFIASGFVSNFGKYSVGKFIGHRAYKIMLPFLIYSVIVAAVLCSIGEIDLPNLLSNGWGGYPLWFVPVLFLASVVVRLVFCIKKAMTKWIMIGSILSAGAVMAYTNFSLPWTLASVPYASFLIFVGKEMSNYSQYIEKYCNIWVVLALTVLTLAVSLLWRMDIAWNNITPVIPLTLGALSGTLMVFMLSIYINHRTTWISSVLQSIGRETYIILAFASLTIMVINHYWDLNPIVKYLILAVVLFILKYIKDGINKVLKVKIL